MRKFVLITVIAVGCALSSTAFAALTQAQLDAVAACQGEKTKPADGIAACTLVLDTIKISAANSAAMHYYRAAFYNSAGATDNGTADYTAAIDGYEKDPGKADWKPDFVGLVMSSYGLRAAAEEKAKKCDAATADFQKAMGMATTDKDRKLYQKRIDSVCQ